MNRKAAITRRPPIAAPTPIPAFAPVDRPVELLGLAVGLTVVGLDVEALDGVVLGAVAGVVEAGAALRSGADRGVNRLRSLLRQATKI